MVATKCYRYSGRHYYELVDDIFRLQIMATILVFRLSGFLVIEKCTRIKD